MEQLVARIRHSGQMRSLTDTLLLTLFSTSDPRPDRVSPGVILFQKDEVIAYWYFILSGEVELYLPSPNTAAFDGGGYQSDLNPNSLFPLSTSEKREHWRQFHTRLPINKDHFLVKIGSGTLFGELNLFRHSCSARVIKPAEFIRINQNHFLNIYSKYADHLQSYICVMEDIVEERTSPLMANVARQQPSTSKESYDPYEFTEMQKELEPMNLQVTNGHENGYEWNPGNLFEITNSVSFESRIHEAGLIIKRTMQTQCPQLIRDRQAQRVVYGQCMVGSEMTKWLAQLASETLMQPMQSFTNLQVIGMWQALLEHHVISHITNEEQFKDKYVFYRWTIDDPFEQYYQSRAEHPNMQMTGGGGLVFPNIDVPPRGAEIPNYNDLQNAIFFLSTIGPDSLFRMILTKPPFERSPEELELVYEELLHVKALAHLSTMVKRELASVIRYEQHQHAGRVLFHQGDEGKSWYIILKGSVDVNIIGKGVVCTLHEGDDFGKLALVNDAPRAATIALAEDNCQFLRVDKHDFNRILRDVEANTVRLKEHDQDVLVLEKINLNMSGSTSSASLKNQCCYSVMAGLPEKMIEYVLETRIDAQTDDTALDTFLEDFILTHIIYMPSNILCNYLKNYYSRRGTIILPTNGSFLSSVESNFDVEQQFVAKRRVIAFLSIWESVFGLNFFLDTVVNSFVEEMYCCVLEDSKSIPNMLTIVDQITALHQLRENAMLVLSRPPTTILDCGIYSANAPAPNPILPIDTCNQCIYLSDTTFITMSVRLDKNASEIADLARCKLKCASTQEECFLIEVKSSGERVVFAPTEVSVPTMLSINGRLYVVFKDEIDSLTPLPDQNGPVELVYHSVLEMMGSTEIANQMCAFHTNLFEATDEIELIFQVIGRDQFPGRQPSNLDILLRRFNEIQYWATTEILLALPAKRVTYLKKLIKIAAITKENKDLMAFFAITLGLSNIAVSRLSTLWDKLSTKIRRQYGEFEALLDPSRNHRAYRMLIAKMTPPVIPFVPLLLKDLTFMHEGNKTYFAGLVNFEKMHMIANVLRSFRNYKTKYNPNSAHHKKILEPQNLIRNFRVIDNQRRLMELSYQIEPPQRSISGR
uniref:Rap guanine nucleotide exchange factor 4 n=1 Tax=Panagrolaimus sp. JU765 TaxID=591449 RepID=A0AC34QSZ1_9BILA